MPRSTSTPVVRPRESAIPAANPGASLDDEASADRRFYNYREVDMPAEPVDGWTLDPAALDALATSRIVVTLFVSSEGNVLYCSVDEPERLPRAARRALEARLEDTRMHPARRGGVAVPSRRRVELFTEGGV